MARRSLTEKQIQALKFQKRTTVPITDSPGLYLRVTTNGVKTYVAVTRDPNGKQHWITIGRANQMSLDVARSTASAAVASVKAGTAMQRGTTFEHVANDWYKRQCEGKQYITAKNKRRYLDMHILPVLGAREFTSVKRLDIATMLDGIEDSSGPAAADEALSIVRAIGNWYATRNDDYVSPVVKGMTRNQAKSRDRVLSDDEIRTLWSAPSSTLTTICKLLLLTGQRRTTVAAMRWEDLDLEAGVWTIPNEGRQKGTGGELLLPEMALDIIKTTPRFVGPWVFPGRGENHFKSYVHLKDGDWTLHDLRRTARSLMSRAGVQPHIAERVLGHAIGGVEGVYDRHSYVTEKADALRKLAGLLANILRPSTDNVVALHG